MSFFNKYTRSLISLSFFSFGTTNALCFGTFLENGELDMELSDHSYKSNQRINQRRVCHDRRSVVRFGDALGRRSSFDRRANQPLKNFKNSLMAFLKGNA